MITIKTVVKPLPQPYKGYAARSLFVLLLPVFLPISIVIEIVDWWKEQREELIDAWHDMKEW